MSHEKKFRLTRQRRMVLEAVKRLADHPSADEVYRAVRGSLPRISLGTVYRNLDVLVQQGLVMRVDSSSAQRRYDGNIEPHYHVSCISCGRVGDATLGHEHDLVPHARGLGGFEILGLKLEFTGLCPDCRSARSAGRN